MGSCMRVDVSLLGAKPPAHPFSNLANPCLRLSRKIKSRRIFCGYSCFEVRNLSYKAPGTQLNLLKDVTLSLKQRSFGLIFGRSGSGKTTLLQLLAGLNKPTSGSIVVQKYGDDGLPTHSPELLLPKIVGIVFQFPERYFLSTNVLEEVTFGWPKQRGGVQLKEKLTANLQQALNWVVLYTKNLSTV
ncbi:ABC transporter I member 11, chloroplastic [Ancistrocladus abbreviatus]